MWATGTGSDVRKRIAAPMVGGIFTSFLLELVVYPAIYEIWKWHFEVKPATPPPFRRSMLDCKKRFDAEPARYAQAR